MWAQFLATGARPALRPPGPGQPAHTRSTWEAIATASMVRAGWSAEEAWTSIESAHPQAMDHARADRRRWVRWVWNRAVLEDAESSPPRPRDVPLERAIAAARERLRSLAWTRTPRARHALLVVGHAVLDRMERTGQARVPVPERDLVLDTGLSDRTTIRAQLRLLGGGVGLLDRDAFDPRRRAESSFEFEIPPAPAPPEGAGVSQLPPPSRHTPRRPLPLVGLPPAAVHLLRVLEESREPAALFRLASQAQLTDSPTAQLTPRQARTVREALTVLAETGLAECSQDGQWRAQRVLDPHVAQASQARRAELETRIAAERNAYRAPVENEWSIARCTYVFHVSAAH